MRLSTIVGYIRHDPADFWGAKTNKMFILTQVGNHDALHYGNLVTYLRINGLEPSGDGFDGPGGQRHPRQRLRSNALFVPWTNSRLVGQMTWRASRCASVNPEYTRSQ
jgi:hypothetical protein